MSSAQHLPEEPFALPTQAFDLRGVRYGELTAERSVGTSQRGVSWLCRCDCGRYAIRTAAYLRQADRNHVTSQCIECARESGRGRFISHRKHWSEWYAVRAALGQSLYTYGQLERIQNQILRDLEDLGFPSPEPPPDLDDVTAPAEEEQACTAFDDSCGVYARTSAGAVYCRWCGNVWWLEERIAQIVVTNAMIERWETTEGSTP